MGAVVRHIWQSLTAEGEDQRFACTGCGATTRRGERPSRKPRRAGQLITVTFYTLRDGTETDRTPDCDRALLIPRVQPASPTPAQELAELRVRCRHLSSEQERLFAEEKLIRARLGAQPHETTIGALERLMAGLG